MLIRRDIRNWKVYLTFYDKEECPHLFFPANYHGCRLLPEDKNECTYENCQFKQRQPYQPPRYDKVYLEALEVFDKMDKGGME